MLRCCRSSIRTTGSKGVYASCFTFRNDKEVPLRRHSTLRHALTREALHEYLSDRPAHTAFQIRRTFSTQGEGAAVTALGERGCGLEKKKKKKVVGKGKDLGKRLLTQGHTVVANVGRALSREVVCNPWVMDEIMALYRVSHAAKLSSEDLEDLISLFGTWCLPENSPHSPYTRSISRGQPLAKCELKRYWDFVSEVQQDKWSDGGERTLADEFWDMQKLIYRAQMARSGSSDQSAILKELEFIYRQSRSRFTHQYLHLCFFATGLDFPSTSHRVAALLCDYLYPNSRQLSTETLTLLWSTILRLSPNPPTQLQQRLVEVVASRIGSAQAHSSELGGCLVNIIFPPRNFATPSASSYCNRIGRGAFDPNIPLIQKWDNLVLLAMAMSPETTTTPVHIDELNTSPPSRQWRTLLFLAYFRAALKQVSLSTNEMMGISASIQSLISRLWQSWTITPGTALPPDVNRAILANFIDVAGCALDERHVRQCFQYSWSQDLHWAQSTQEQAAITDLHATYAVALARCRAYNWGSVFPHIKATVSEHIWDRVLLQIALKLVPHGVEGVRPFTTFLASREIILPASTTLKLAITLVNGRDWSTALPLLSDPRFSPSQIETLAISFLQHFRFQRTELISSSLATQLSDALLRIYTDQPPSPASRYPIRYFLKLMISVGQGAKVVELISHIVKHDHEFFTQRAIRRYSAQLLSRKKPIQAVRLVFLVQDLFKPSEGADLNRKLFIGLSAINSAKHAKQVLGARKPSEHGFQTPRERMQRGELLKRHSRPCHSYLQVMHIANRVSPNSPSYIPAIRFALSFLVKHQRTLAARKLYARTWPHLDSKTHTLFGNMILHGCYTLRRLNLKKARRHMVHVLQILRESYGFQPDRSTVNIISKVLIFCCPRRDTRPLRVLVDEFVRRGYPASGRALGQRKVPFGTPRESPYSPQWADIPWPDPSKAIVFRKHVQPLYKMLITAFYLRKDVAAAKTVLAMLKDAKLETTQELEKRNVARREGIARKKARLARLAARRAEAPS